MRPNPITIQWSAYNLGRPLTALAVVLYLRRESSTWDLRQPLGGSRFKRCSPGPCEELTKC
jgi:hypothetical protein